jgi:hypothetical protein
MSIDQRDLVKAVRNYRSIDDKLKSLNKDVYKLRENKKVVETEMSDILRRANFEHIYKLEIADDDSYIRIQRPEMWSKPWTLGARELQGHLDEYFKTHAGLNAESCFKFIVERKKRDMVSKEFSFTRMMPLDSNTNDDGAGSP